MALNGSFYGSTSNQYIKPKIEWSAVQDTAGNYSDVTATLTYSRTNTGYTTSGTWSGSITINGETKTGSKYLEITYGSNTVAISHTVRVSHDDYGEKTITISASGAISGTTLEKTTISGSAVLDTIARASTVGATAAGIGEVTMIAVNRKNGAFTHSIAYRFGGLSGYIGTDWLPGAEEVRLTDTSISFTVPTDFYTQIPDSPTGECTLICTTYAGDEIIGQTTAAFTVTAKEDICRPVVTGTVEDANEVTLTLTGDAGVLVQGFSTAACTITVQAQNSASIAQKAVNGLAVADTLLIPNVETGSFTFQAVDSRGYSGKYQVPADQVQLIPYIRLTANPTGKRLGPTSEEAQLTVKGKFFGGSFGAWDNELTVKYRVGSGEYTQLEPVIDGDDYTVTALVPGLDYTKSHTIEVVVSDCLDSVTRTLPIQKGVPVFDWGEGDFAFHVPVTFHGGITGLGQITYPVGSIYMSVNETSPADLFGGTWERLKDTFLLAAGDTYAAGATGGEAEHTLTEEEMPAHSHGFLDYWSTAKDTAAGRSAVAVNGDGTGLNGSGANTRAKTADAGAGIAHNNMPPYLAVYIWKRTA